MTQSVNSTSTFRLNLFAWAERLGRKQIAEHLQRGHFSRCRRLVAPFESFENQ